MKKRYLFPLLLAAIGMALPGSMTETSNASAQGGTTEIRIATLAPEGSPWMNVFNAWNQSLQEANVGLSLRFYPGGSQGDERDFIRKMRESQLDGAAVTTTGLGQVNRSALVLSVPGIITEYAQMDRVRRRLNRRLVRGFNRSGIHLLGWGDVGRSRIFSTRRIRAALGSPLGAPPGPGATSPSSTRCSTSSARRTAARWA